MLNFKEVHELVFGKPKERFGGSGKITQTIVTTYELNGHETVVTTNYVYENNEVIEHTCNVEQNK